MTEMKQEPEGILRTRRPRLLGGLAALAAALMTLGGLPVVGAWAEQPEFCDAPSANPHLEPLAGLPLLPKLPADGMLPFAPSLHIKAVRGPLVVRGEPVGFRLAPREGSQGSGADKPRLRVLLVVSLMGANGEAQRLVSRRIKQVRFDEATNLVLSRLLRMPFIGSMLYSSAGTAVGLGGTGLTFMPHRPVSQLALKWAAVK